MLRQIEINYKAVRHMYGKRNSEELMDYIIEKKTGNKSKSNYEDQCRTLQRQVEEQKEEIRELLS